jgi:transposase
MSNYYKERMEKYVSRGPVCCNETMELKYASHRGSIWRCRRCGETKDRDW